MQPVAALYVETDGCYFGLPDVDPWDEARDARRYAGPHPVVAHPPCQRWGKLWAGQPLWIKRTGQRKKKGDDNGCFAAALDVVRRFGGVIEHPWGSHAWPHFGLKVPSRKGGWIKADEHGGWTCCVEQGGYGHYARKPTMLYAVGTDRPEIKWGETEARLDPEVVKRMGLKRAKRLGEVGAKGGGKDSSPRIGTPSPFRDLLLALARSVNRVSSVSNCSFTEGDNRATEFVNPKEKPVTIRIEITGDNASQVASQLLQFTATMSQLLQPRAATTAAVHEGPAPDVVETVAEQPAAPARRGRPRKAETIEHETKEQANVHRDAGGDTDGGGASADGEAPAGGSAADAMGGDGGHIENAAHDESSAVDEVAAPASVAEKLTIDEVRAYTITNYLNAVFETQPERTAAFRELMDAVGVTKFGEVPVERLGEVKAMVDAKIAAAAGAK